MGSMYTRIVTLVCLSLVICFCSQTFSQKCSSDGTRYVALGTTTCDVYTCFGFYEPEEVIEELHCSVHDAKRTSSGY